MFENDKCIITDNSRKNQKMMISRCGNNMFPLDITNVESLNVAVKKQTQEELWHLRFGHLNYRSLSLLSRKKMVKGILVLKEEAQCEGCVMAKQARSPFPSGMSRRASSCLELVHMDLCGPMSEESLGGNRYFYLFVDDYSRWCWVFFIKNKS